MELSNEQRAIELLAEAVKELVRLYVSTSIAPHIEERLKAVYQKAIEAKNLVNT